MTQTLSQQQLQEQKLIQQQRITQQHLLNVKLLSMSLTELEQSVNAAINDNPALERAFDEESSDSFPGGDADSFSDENDADSIEREERQDELNKAFESMESDDEPTEREFDYSQDANKQGDLIYGEDLSFRDKLNEQMGELNLTETEHSIMEYLIGSLDNDGFLRKETDVIVDELAVYEYVSVTNEDVERVLRMIQAFDPPGLGARSLQECLRIQINRKEEGKLKECMLCVVDKYFNAFKKMRWDKIKSSLKLNDTQIDTLKCEFRKLNPKPGASLEENIGRNIHQITPDFIIYTSEDGRVLFDVNTGNLPGLTISDSFTEMLSNYQNTSEKELNKTDYDAMIYLRKKVEQANWFIEAVRQRQQTMESTMRAIIYWQRKFFITGEESDLRPMILKDIAKLTGLDISTISRVSNEKYAQTQWGTFPLRYFFTDKFISEQEVHSTRKVKAALKEIIETEDKSNPFSDEALVEKMKKHGFTIARRTIAKYRDKMGIPTSKLRMNR